MSRTATRVNNMVLFFRRHGVPVEKKGRGDLSLPGFQIVGHGRTGWSPDSGKTYLRGAALNERLVRLWPESLVVTVQFENGVALEDSLITMRAKDWVVLASAFIQTDPERYMIQKGN